MIALIVSLWLSLGTAHAEELVVRMPDKASDLECTLLYYNSFGMCSPRTHSLCLSFNDERNSLNYQRCWQKRNSFWVFQNGTSEIRTSGDGPSMCVDYAPLAEQMRGVTKDFFVDFRLGIRECNGSDTQLFFRDNNSRIHLAKHPHMCLGSSAVPFVFSTAVHAVDCGKFGLRFDSDVHSDLLPLEPLFVRLTLCISMVSFLCLSAYSFHAAAVWVWPSSGVKTRPSHVAMRWKQCWKQCLSILCPSSPAARKLLREHRLDQANRFFFIYLLGVPVLLMVEFSDLLALSDIDSFLVGGMEGMPHGYQEYDRAVGYLLNRSLLPNICAGLLVVWGHKYANKQSIWRVNVIQVCLAARFIGSTYLRLGLESHFEKTPQEALLRLFESVALGNAPLVIFAQGLVTMFEIVASAFLTVNVLHVNQSNYRNLQLMYYLALVLITCICEKARLAHVEMCAQLIGSRAIASKLLDQASNGFCAMNTHGRILHASPELEVTLNTNLEGKFLADFLQDGDDQALEQVFRTPVETEPVGPVLVTFQAAGEDGLPELFDARIVLYSASETEICICVNVVGERRYSFEQFGDAADSENSLPQNVTGMPAGMSVQEEITRVKSVQGKVSDMDVFDQFGDAADAENVLPQNVALSVHSLPAKWTGRKAREPPCDGRDCLSESVLVQVLGCNNQPLRKQVGELEEGDFVQCLDHLSRTTRYVPVTAIKRSTGQCMWVKATLADNTELEMTADHPVRTAGRFDNKLAASLIPFQDQMWITKTESIVVKDVKVCEDTKPRISVSFAQNIRFSMFVSQRGKPFSAVAVESADYAQDLPSFKNTFLHYAGSEVSISTAPASAPAEIGRSGTFDPLVQPLSHTVADQMQAAATRTQYSVSTDSAATSSVDSLDATFHLQGGNFKSRVVLSDFRETLGSATKSLGSWSHGQTCSPCRFQHRHYQDSKTHPACRNGKLCGACHDFHSEEYVRQARMQSTNNRRRKKNITTSL